MPYTVLHPSQLTVCSFLSVSGAEWSHPGTCTCLGICVERCTCVNMCIPVYMCCREDICGCTRVWLQCEWTGGLVWVRRGHIWRTGLRTMARVVIGRCCWGSCWGGTLWLGNPSSNLGSSSYPSCPVITAAPARAEGDQLAFLKLDSLLQRYSKLSPRTPVSEILIIFIECLLCFQLFTYSNIFNSETSLC